MKSKSTHKAGALAIVPSIINSESVASHAEAIAAAAISDPLTWEAELNASRTRRVDGMEIQVAEARLNLAEALFSEGKTLQMKEAAHDHFLTVSDAATRRRLEEIGCRVVEAALTLGVAQRLASKSAESIADDERTAEQLRALLMEVDHPKPDNSERTIEALRKELQIITEVVSEYTDTLKAAFEENLRLLHQKRKFKGVASYQGCLDRQAEIWKQIDELREGSPCLEYSEEEREQFNQARLQLRDITARSTTLESNAQADAAQSRSAAFALENTIKGCGMESIEILRCYELDKKTQAIIAGQALTSDGATC